MNERDLQRYAQAVDKQIEVLNGRIVALAAIEAARGELSTAEKTEVQTAISSLPHGQRQAASEFLDLIEKTRAQKRLEAPEDH